MDSKPKKSLVIDNIEFELLDEPSISYNYATGKWNPITIKLKETNYLLKNISFFDDYKFNRKLVPLIGGDLMYNIESLCDYETDITFKIVKDDDAEIMVLMWDYDYCSKTNTLTIKPFDIIVENKDIRDNKDLSDFKTFENLKCL